MARDHAVPRDDLQPVPGSITGQLPSGRIEYRAVPGEGDAIIIVPIVRIALPIPRESDRARCLLEAPAPDQLRVPAALDPLHHEFEELAVGHRALAPDRPAC